MILQIKQFFEKHLKSSDTPDNLEHRLRLACAILLVEMVQADLEIDPQEEIRLRQIIRTRFNLDSHEIESVLELAGAEIRSAADYYQFTSLINEHYTQAQKIELVEQLWQLAWADERIDKFEEHLVRKLAELLHVPHKHFMQAKHRVLGNQ